MSERLPARKGGVSFNKQANKGKDKVYLLGCGDNESSVTHSLRKEATHGYFAKHSGTGIRYR